MLREHEFTPGGARGRAPRPAWGFLAAALCAALLLPSAARAGEPQLYLSWHAPHGWPRATDTLSVACGDSTREDTLFLSFDPGADSASFNGFTATLYLRAAPTDSLGPWWRLTPEMGLSGRFRVEFAGDSTDRYHSPFRVRGTGRSLYDHTSTSARARLIYAVPWHRAVGVKKGETYTLARILLRRPPPEMAQCGQPLCIEWAVSGLAFQLRSEPQVNRGGARFASLNSPKGAVCATFRGVPLTQPWRPKTGRVPVRK